MLNINYVAGIFDGEGSIGIHKRSYKESARGYLYSPKIRLGMTGIGISIVENLRNQFGGSLSLRRYSTKNKDLLTWTITSRKEIIYFLESIGPLLIVKQQQAIEVKDFYQNGSYKQKDWKSNRMSDVEYRRREILCEKVKLLNKKCK